jgi:hypothetical protein
MAMNLFAKKSISSDEQYLRDLFDPSVVNQLNSGHKTKTKGRLIGLSAVLVLLVAAGIFAVSYGWSKPEAYAFLELKAITPSGHPVAGAEVVLDGKTMGFTDSFGEWRKFVSVSGGETLLFSFSKSTEAENFTGEKNIAIPVEHEKGHEVEIKSTAQLRSQAGSKAVVQRPDQKNETHNPWSKMNLVFGPGVSEELKTALSDHLQALGLTIAAAGNVKITIDQLLPSHHKLLRLKVEEEKGRVMPRTALIKAVGLAANNVDEIVELTKMLVPYPFEFVRTGNRWILEKSTPTFWLPNGKLIVQNDKMKEFEVDRAQDGRYEITSLGNSGEPCNDSGRCKLIAPTLNDMPPHDSLKPMRMQIMGRISREVEIYVSGYRANHVEPSFWEYWGKEGEVALVTVVKDRAVVQREKIQSSLAKPPKFVLQDARIAKN